jgi:hypothetical protein
VSPLNAPPLNAPGTSSRPRSGAGRPRRGCI